MSQIPYPGLRPFHRDEADIFFGRDEQVDQLLAKLSKSRFLAVVGSSGCGKSSLIFTGLLNALEAGFLADVGLHWRIATLRPGAHPMRNLADALVKQGNVWTKDTAASEINGTPAAGTAAEDSTQTAANPHTNAALLQSALRRGPLGLVEALQEDPLPAGTNLLIVVDQFEEIFRYRQHQDRDEADAFVALLLRSISENTVPVYVVITMRSDFLGDCALFPGLPEALNNSQFLTPRLTRSQRRQAIVGPAKVFAGDVEPALVNRLLNDTGTDPDQLPVLQHALMQLWITATQRGDQPVQLALTDYEKLGGWDNTLSNHADQAYDELSEAQKAIAKILFQSLSERSGAKRDTRRPVTVEAVASVAGVDTAEVIPVIDVFRRGDRSFLTPPEGHPLSADSLIDISHESLIRQWQRMKDWVEQEAKAAETYRRLEQTALMHDNGKAGLLQDLDLLPIIEWKRQTKPNNAWAQRYGQEFDRAMNFLSASMRREKLKTVVKSLFTIFLAAVAIAMTMLWNQAETERNKATVTRILTAAQLLRNEKDENYHLSALWGIEALKRTPNPNFVLNQIVSERLQLLPKPLQQLQNRHPVSQIAYSPNDTRLATISGGMVHLWDAASGTELRQFKYDQKVNSVTFSADSNKLTSVNGNTVYTRDVASNKKVEKSFELNEKADFISFSTDGNKLASVVGNTVRVRNVSDKKVLWSFKHDSSVHSVTMNTNGNQMASISGNIVHVWDVLSRKKLHSFKHENENYVNSVIFSTNGNKLASVVGSSVHVWDVASGKAINSFKHESNVNAIAFSTDGSKLASTNGKIVHVWDVVSGKEIRRAIHENEVSAVTFSTDGNTLASASENGTVRTWNLVPSAELQRFEHENTVGSVTLNVAGNKLASVVGSTVRIWDVASGKPFRDLEHKGNVSSLTFSTDGNKLASVVGSTVHVWDVASGKKLWDFDHRDNVHFLTFSPDDNKLVSVSEKTAYVWDAASGKPLRDFEHKDNMRFLTFSADGYKLASLVGSTVHVWDVTSGKRLWDFEHKDNEDNEDYVTSAIFSANGNKLASSGTQTAYVWDVTAGKKLRNFKVKNRMHFFTFSADASKLAASMGGGTTYMWDIALDKRWDFEHADEVDRVTFSADGYKLASTSGKEALVWDIASGKKLLQRFKHEDDVKSVSFSAESKFLVTTSGNTVHLWSLHPSDLIAQLCERMVHNLSLEQWQEHLADESYQKTCPHLPVATNFRNQGGKLIEQGRGDELIRIIRELNAVDPDLKLNVQQELQKLTIPARLEKAETLFYQKRFAEVFETYHDIEQIETGRVSAVEWNKLCWEGALSNIAAQVIPACDHAVAMVETQPYNLWMHRDSRGLARALSGDFPGAIADFEFMIEKTDYDEYRKQRQEWVKALRAGQNPFTSEVLDLLHDQ